MKYFILVVVALACGAAPKETDWCRLHRCEVAGVLKLDPAPELAAVVDSGMQRWEAATGLDLHFEAGGTKVEYVDDLMGPDLSDPLNPKWPEIHYCATTNVGEYYDARDYSLLGTTVHSIQINRNAPSDCNDLKQIIMHELGHALDWNGLHTERGIMSPGSYPNGLDDESMNLVCSYAPCSVFIPERHLRVQE